MKFLDLFNEIHKGDFGLTDEAIYISIQNGGTMIPLYGGNKSHINPERYISEYGKTKYGKPITIFSGEGIIISLDGSAGNMTYKENERFALNHHAGFITLKKSAESLLDLRFFATFFQNHYKAMSVSDGSKTLSLRQIYSEDLNIPSIEIQNSIMKMLNQKSKILQKVELIRENLLLLYEKNIYQIGKCDSDIQAENVLISNCIDYMSGNTGLTEEFIYTTIQDIKSEKCPVLSSSTEDNTMMGYVSRNAILPNGKPLKIFEGKEGLLVIRNGKAGQTKFLKKGLYTINDHAYILFVRNDCPYNINLKWLSIQYKADFFTYASSADNGTWNMTGFFNGTRIDIPSVNVQQKIVDMYEIVKLKIDMLNSISKRYQELFSKEIF
jgi:restriction endonuclease S subunit